ncbi:hypothetical protein [Streptomyces minutiscleroticus]|uniref:Uncharacterized protein n=1 Tax=Streptomyces minutiscleroticus TaxID=68238 RepID=A0A918K893_9ACTN|nr:hypothetical protein [Streptomyces minutiscleroticus]GGX54575.1 hypothetical protein GCM10010358_05810 [Streptomyces minutiscleroticus]
MRSGGAARALSLDTVVRVRRTMRASGDAAARRLSVPTDMQLPLGCDAVSTPARLGAEVVHRLPRIGCVYADGADWWWIVPSDSDVAVQWPAPAHYAAGAFVPSDAPRRPSLIHRPESTVPYTPPIPLYLALCGATGTTPAWSRPVGA